ncbi:hypothetical protein TIFTF001_003865 [Ficus carica]|uniref:Uncharacterized protein n=1 Tax=Ficus carica TaxID=3494 RepID=A0AA88CWR2_FICCA|nr:hypothetical protein TIFTF001_003865 [Ficus carica]
MASVCGRVANRGIIKSAVRTLNGNGNGIGFSLLHRNAKPPSPISYSSSSSSSSSSSFSAAAAAAATPPPLRSRRFSLSRYRLSLSLSIYIYIVFSISLSVSIYIHSNRWGILGRYPVELGSVESLMPLHNAVAAARMTACLSTSSLTCRSLFQGTLSLSAPPTL